jgi:hypothetical protein
MKMHHIRMRNKPYCRHFAVNLDRSLQEKAPLRESSSGLSDIAMHAEGHGHCG